MKKLILTALVMTLTQNTFAKDNDRTFGAIGSAADVVSAVAKTQTQKQPQTQNVNIEIDRGHEEINLQWQSDQNDGPNWRRDDDFREREINRPGQRGPNWPGTDNGGGRFITDCRQMGWEYSQVTQLGRDCKAPGVNNPLVLRISDDPLAWDIQRYKLQNCVVNRPDKRTREYHCNLFNPRRDGFSTLCSDAGWTQYTGKGFDCVAMYRGNRKLDDRYDARARNEAARYFGISDWKANCAYSDDDSGDRTYLCRLNRSGGPGPGDDGHGGHGGGGHGGHGNNDADCGFMGWKNLSEQDQRVWGYECLAPYTSRTAPRGESDLNFQRDIQTFNLVAYSSYTDGNGIKSYFANAPRRRR